MSLGAYARNTGCFQVWKLEGASLKKCLEKELPHALKCGTFGASSLSSPGIATGDFAGRLAIYDAERGEATFTAQAHSSIINSIDGAGGPTAGYGAPEVVTGGRDGRVCVWDPRQEDAPVASFEPAGAGDARDCWSVAFGNSYNDDERSVLAGYDNGDVKLFDLRTNAVRWETNVRNGVCGVQFDRQDIKMNKFVVTCLEAQFHVFDARTQHKEKGFSSLTEQTKKGSTVWGVRHLPQNRELSMVLGGDGTVNLYKYHYPDQRQVKAEDNELMGVAGSMELLCSKEISSQPVACFDWSPDKEGLCCMGSFDQTIRVGFVTKLNRA